MPTRCGPARAWGAGRPTGEKTKLTRPFHHHIRGSICSPFYKQNTETQRGSLIPPMPAWSLGRSCFKSRLFPLRPAGGRRTSKQRGRGASCCPCP